MPALTPEQLAARRKKIGGSECAVVLGMDPWSNPEKLFFEKLGLTHRDQNAAMGWGHWMERVIADKYLTDLTVKLGYEPVMLTSDTMNHKTIPWIIATPDRFVETKGETYLLQIKNVGRNAVEHWGDFDTDEVPDHVACQVQWEMSVARSHGYAVERAVVAACLAGSSPTYYNVPWDEDFFEILRKANEDFVTKFLLPEIAPPFDYRSPFAEHRLRIAHPRNDGTMLSPDTADSDLARLYAESRRKADEAHELMSLARVQLEARIGDHDGLQGDDWKATWKLQRGKVDYKAIVENMGVEKKTLERFRASSSRVFRLTVKGEERKEDYGNE